MSKLQSGFLLIADITGYTAFLSKSELEHAEDSLRTLLDLLIDHTQLPLVISRLEGDAVISYAVDGSFLQGQTLVEMIENTYLAFRKALELMVLNTNCTCNACRNLVNLDLKAFVHYGTFMLQVLPTYTELIGNDVNLIHRLTKNTVLKSTGIEAYILYTAAAVEKLGIQEEIKRMTPHNESYEHVGEITTYIRDMHAFWDEERDRVRTSVQSEDAQAVIEKRYPVSSMLMWDYVTKPEYKAILTNSTTAVVDNRTNGRIGLGATYYCAHGKSASQQTIVDWQPPLEYTYVGDPFMGSIFYVTTRLIPDGESTRVQILIGKIQRGHLPVRIALGAVFPLLVKRFYKKAMQELLQRIEEEIEEGAVIRPAAITISADEIKRSVTESLATT